MRRSAALLLISLLMALVGVPPARAGSEFPELTRLITRRRVNFWQDIATFAGRDHLRTLEQRVILCQRRGELKAVLGLALDNLKTIASKAVTRPTKSLITRQAIGLARVSAQLCPLPDTEYTHGPALSAYRNPDEQYHLAELRAVRQVLRTMSSVHPPTVLQEVTWALKNGFKGDTKHVGAVMQSLDKYLREGMPVTVAEINEWMEYALRAYPLTEGVISDKNRNYGVIAVRGKGQAVQVTEREPGDSGEVKYSHLRLRWADKLDGESPELKGVLIMLDQYERKIRLERPRFKRGSIVGAIWRDREYIPHPAMPRVGDLKKIADFEFSVDLQGNQIDRGFDRPEEKNEPPPGPMMEGIGF